MGGVNNASTTFVFKLSFFKKFNYQPKPIISAPKSPGKRNKNVLFEFYQRKKIYILLKTRKAWLSNDV